MKFFRNIRQRLLSERRIRKYCIYAFGEIVLVMIGILLALQVNNWNNKRIQNKKEAIYIENIHKQFLFNKTQLDVVTLYHQKVYDNVSKILSLVPIDDEHTHMDSLSSYVSGTFYQYTFNPQQSTINSLTNTSSYDIVSNNELRERLQSWEELVKDYQEEEISYQNYFHSSFLPYFKNHISLFNHSNGTNIFDDDNITSDFLNSLEFKNTMVLQRNYVYQIIAGNEIKEVNHAINRIIELTRPK